MENKISPYSSAGFIIAVIGLAMATIMLNVHSLQYEPVNRIVAIICPLLIATGIYGTIRQIRLIRMLGWVGIVVFTLYAINMILPGDDYMSGGPDGPSLSAPRLPSYAEIGIRFVIVIFTVVALSYGFARLGKYIIPREIK